MAVVQRKIPGYVPRGGPGTGRCQAGFTLMEILVAVAVLAISLVVIMQLFSGGLRSARTAADHNRAVFHAREKIEEILAFDQIEEGIEEGDFGDGYRWWAETVRVVEEAPSDEDAVDEVPFDIVYVHVVVSWGEGRWEKRVELETAKPVSVMTEEV